MTTFKFTDYASTFYNMANSIGGIATTQSDAEKTEATKELVTTVAKSIFLVLDKTIGAKEKTAENAQAARNLDNDAKDIKTRTYARAEKVISKIEENAARVAALLEELDKTSQEVIEYQKQLEGQKNIIETNKAILNDPNKSRKERIEALNNIKTAGDAISDLESAVLAYTEQAEALSAGLEDATSENEDLNTAGEETIQDGSSKIQQVVSQGAGEVTQTVTSTATQGTKDIAEGTAQVATGTSMLATPATAALGEKYIIQGNNSITAGGIETAQSAITIGDITSTLSFGMRTIGQINTFGNTITSGYGNNANLLGQLGTTLAPFITTLGSWTSIEGTGAEFVAQAEQEIANLDGDKNSDGNQDEATGNADLFDTKKLKLETPV